MSVESSPARAASSTALRARRGLAVLGATVAASVLWLLADPLAGIDLTARFNGAPRPVGLGAVVAASLLAGLAGWALLAVLERVLARPRRTWTIVAIVVLALSLSGPVGSGVGAAGTTTLVALHLVVAAVLIAGLRRPQGR